MTAANASDIRQDHWLYRRLPRAVRPYASLARLDRPSGTWLLLLPGWWAIALAPAGSGQWPDWRLVLLFALGALVMRGAGCTINDIADREFDAKVARTATRPLPSGAVTLHQAFAFLGLQLAIALAILLCLNATAIWVGAASLALVVVYPFMKRITYWPQAFLGLTFNWGCLLGWAAATGGLDWPAVALYAGGIAWTLVYDTIYAHQDRADDALVGVKSTALRFGRATQAWIGGFAVLAVGFWALAGWLQDVAWPWYAGVCLAALHLAWQVATLDIDDPQGCKRRFQSNRWTGLVLVLGALAAAAWTRFA